TILDSSDPYNDTYTITGSTFTRAYSSSVISYSAMNVLSFDGGSTSAATYNVQDIDNSLTININTGWGGNTVNAQETFGTLNVTSGGSDTVNVGDAGSVQDVLGTLNIENPTSTTTLNIDDSADTTVLPNVALDTFTPSGDTPWGSITGLAPAVINY